MQRLLDHRRLKNFIAVLDAGLPVEAVMNVRQPAGNRKIIEVVPSSDPELQAYLQELRAEAGTLFDPHANLSDDEEEEEDY